MTHRTAAWVISVAIILGFGGQAALAQAIGHDPAGLVQAAEARPTFKKVNIDVGGGVYAPVLQVTQPNGDVSYIRIGEQGLSRSILFDTIKLRAYTRDLMRKERSARKKG